MLAIELISEALEYLTIPLELSFLPLIEEHKPKHAVLAACSLVCKDWSYLAQRLLFQRVFIRSDKEKPFTVKTIDAFLSAIDPHTEKGAWLASCIRIFIFAPLEDPRWVEIGVVSSKLFSTLLRMPNLCHLDLYGAMCTFSDAQLAQLRAEGPQLKSLAAYLGETWETPRTVDSQENVYRLASCFPSIQALHITSSPADVLRPASPSLNLSLRVFIVSFYGIRKPVERFIASLARAPDVDYDGLKVLRVTHAGLFTESTEEEYLVQTFGPTLLSLSVSLSQLSTAAVLRHCSQLKHLELLTFPHSALLTNLPCTLEDLALPSGRPTRYGSLDVGVDLAPLMAELEVLPRLRRLTLLYCESLDEPRFDALRVLCAQRDIELQATSGQYVNGHDLLIAVYKDLLELNLK